MSGPARVAEADRASVAFQTALAQLGVATIEDALKLWQGVPPARTAVVSAAWLRRAVELVMTRRGRSRDLAMAYYRLARALRTGTTVADPRRPEPAYVTLGMLRREFAALAGPPEPTPRAPAPKDTDSSPPEEPAPGAAEAAGQPSDDDDDDDDDEDRVLVEQIGAVEREHERLERLAEDEARNALEELAEQPGPQARQHRHHRTGR